ncbi:hypothetical protein BD413DRAFT_234422 [Trametes elegans]|nr:hypothetical protein BD413DRAFT_234422 [Trametes elegans]
MVCNSFGIERCRLSTGARIGIAIAAVVAFLLALVAFRTARVRSARRANLTYVGTVPAGGAPPPQGQPYQGYPAPGPNGYPAPGSNGYFPNQDAYAPQYPPQTYSGQSPYPSPNPAPGNLPQYAPPPGPPPNVQGTPPQYAPPPGPPPGAEQKH